jgi:hypothetical protein
LRGLRLSGAAVNGRSGRIRIAVTPPSRAYRARDKLERLIFHARDRTLLHHPSRSGSGASWIAAFRIVAGAQAAVPGSASNLAKLRDARPVARLVFDGHAALSRRPIAEDLPSLPRCRFRLRLSGKDSAVWISPTATVSWPQPSRSAATPWAETAGSLEISTAATRQAGLTRQPRLDPAVAAAEADG